jgi:O-succinylbenzoate synthase
MNIAYSPYELEANHSLSVTSSVLKRQGALLKFTFEPGIVGYADCHPWPELGDLPLKQQLESLARGQFTPLTRCAWEFAKLDAEARWNSRQILAEQSIPRSHFLVTYLPDWTSQHVQQVIQQGYTHLKLKMGRHLDQEIQSLHSLFLNSTLKLRLDFNESLTSANFCNFLHRIEKLQGCIEFIEDPFPYQVEEWTAIQKEGWTLACDRQAHRACLHPESARILIVKPALQTFHEWQTWIHQIRIVTSYLGHPLGQMAAAYVAAQVDPSCSFVHGLLSHHVYCPTSFSQQLNWKDPRFAVPRGQGFGFDQELEQLQWVVLS